MRDAEDLFKMKASKVIGYLKILRDSHGWFIKRYKDRPHTRYRIEGAAVASAVLSIFGVLSFCFGSLGVANTAISFAGGSTGTMPKVIGKSYTHAKGALAINGYTEIDPITEQPQYLTAPNAIVVRQSPQPGPIYKAETIVSLTVKVKRPRLGKYRFDRSLNKKDEDRITQTQIRLTGIDIIKFEGHRSAIAYLQITNFQDSSITVPALNTHDQMTKGVVLEDNNSVNGIGYPVESFGAVGPDPSQWSISKSLTITPHRSFPIFIQFGGVRDKAGEYRFSLDFGNDFTDFGTIDRIRLSDRQD